jgi:hypothetical protein
LPDTARLPRVLSQSVVGHSENVVLLEYQRPAATANRLELNVAI